MYPNPQDALPLPPRPGLEQYKKRAKDLVKACKTDVRDPIRVWAAEWIEGLVASQGKTDRPQNREQIHRWVEQVEQFARTKLSRDQHHAKCALADAQFVIARAHGFIGWPTFSKHLDALARATSPVSAFEAAADAVVGGDTATIERLLREDPDLVRTRSTREHRATLLHYVSANGIENYRQRTPKNAVKIAEILLAAGAEVDSEADVYGGGATTLGLVATSHHPLKAGVQNDLIDVLLKHGARLDHPRGAGNNHNLVNGCLANGRREAAEYLASRGSTLDLEGAAGVGQLDVVKSFFNDDGTLKANTTATQMGSGFSWACEYGRDDVVKFLLSRGMEVNSRLRPHGQTGLHYAAYGAHVEIAATLLRQGAEVEPTDDRWGTTPLVWALYAWSEEPTAPPERYHAVVALLVAAGAVVKPEWFDGAKVRADPRMLEALTGQMRNG